jgi:SAM-dependent methyltransferase
MIPDSKINFSPPTADCAICGTPAQNFLEDKPRFCPTCGSLERQRALAQLYQDFLQDEFSFRNKRILVIGPSSPEIKFLESLEPQEIVTLDVRELRKPNIVADVCSMPQVPDESFDVVLASFVLTMVYDLDAAISELARILRRGGRLLTYDPLVFGEPTHERYTLTDITAWYGQEEFGKFRIGEFRQLGDMGALDSLARYFFPKTLYARDPITNAKVVWIFSVKRSVGRHPWLAARRVDFAEIYLLPGIAAAQQRKKGFQPRSDCIPWPLMLPLQWDADPFNDVNWQFQLHAWRMTDPLIRDWLDTGETESLKEAFAFAEDWYDFHFGPQAKTARFSWADMATGIRALRIAVFYDLHRAGRLSLSQGSAAKLLDLLEKHALKLQEPNSITRSNHGLLQIFGLNLLSKAAPELAVCRNGLLFAKQMFRNILDSQFTSEGVHKEHSPEYHAFVINLLNTLGAFAEFRDACFGELMDRAQRILLWLVHPNGVFAAFGDTSAKPARLKAPLFNVDGIGQEFRLDASEQSFLLGDFSRSGYVIVRSQTVVPEKEQSMLFFSGMCYSRVHKHADDLSFELFEKGVMLIVDAGKYGYNENPLRQYFVSAAAHNTISLRNVYVGPAQTPAYGSCLKTPVVEKDFVHLSGALTRESLFTHKRELYYWPGQFLIIDDLVSAGDERDYVSSLHFAPSLTVERASGCWKGIVGECPFEVQVFAENCIVRLEEGKVSPDYLQVVSNSVLRASSQAREQRFLWIISFGDAGRLHAKAALARLGLPDARTQN